MMFLAWLALTALIMLAIKIHDGARTDGLQSDKAITLIFAPILAAIIIIAGQYC